MEDIRKRNPAALRDPDDAAAEAAAEAEARRVLPFRPAVSCVGFPKGLGST